MPLIKWDPFRDLMNLHSRFGRPFGDFDDSWGSWTPLVDIFERGDDLIIRAEIPGVERDDIEVEVEGNTLVLRGERKREAEFKEDDAYRLERAFGTFVRSFRLPKTVDSSRIAAAYTNGVLEVTLPKAEESKPKKVEIKVA